jgi:pimeloyl-ACP methyl ester carboxylesterase
MRLAVRWEPCSCWSLRVAWYVGAVVSLDPGGFRCSWERQAFYASVYASVRLVRLLQPVMPFLTGNAIGRTLLRAQFSAHPWKLSSEVTLEGLRSFTTSPSFDELAYGETQQVAPLNSVKHPLVIGWGRNDHVCFPKQAKRALKLFPDARLHWFEHCEHFPQWDALQETTRLILTSTNGAGVPKQ